MNLVGYTATALSRNDIEDTPTNKNVVDGAIVELKTLSGDLVVIYDDENGTNPETQKACDSDGQCEFYAEAGDYNLEVNGKVNKISLFFNKDKVNDIDVWGDRFVGYFSDGFTYTKADDVAKGVDGKYYSYSGASAYPVVVNAGTVPSEPEYTPVVLSDAESVTDVRGTNVQDYINNNLTPFKTVADMKASGFLSSLPEFTRIEWQGYCAQSDGGSNWGVLRFGAHTEDGGSIFSIDANTYIEANLKGKKINARKWGAKIDSNFNASNSPTDDTLAIQNLINFLDGENNSICYIPCGFAMVTRLVPKAGIKIKGDGAGITYLVQKQGETTPILEDEGSIANFFLEDIALDCNNNTVAGGKAGVYLGHAGQQMGVVAGFRQVFVRNVIGDGININGNVAIFDWVEVYFCTGEGFIVNGEGNKLSNIITSNCGLISLHLKGSSNTATSVHAEGQSSTACVVIGNNTVGNTLNDLKITGVGGNIHGAGVLIESNASNYNLTNIRASVTSSANIANGLIHDLSSGVRKIYGYDTGGVSFSVPSYSGGVRVNAPWNGSTPPSLGTFKVGDWFVSGVGLSGYPNGWSVILGGETPTWTPMEVTSGAIVDTTSRTMSESDMGRRYSNEGATAIVTHELPTARIGARMHFTRRSSSFAYRIKARSGNLVRPAGIGKYISLDTDCASVSLEYMGVNTWAIVAQSGVISLEP